MTRLSLHSKTACQTLKLYPDYRLMGQRGRLKKFFIGRYYNSVTCEKCSWSCDNTDNKRQTKHSWYNQTCNFCSNWRLYFRQSHNFSISDKRLLTYPSNKKQLLKQIIFIPKYGIYFALAKDNTLQVSPCISQVLARTFSF